MPNCRTCWACENAKIVATRHVAEIADFPEDVHDADEAEIAEIVKIGKNAAYDNNADCGEIVEFSDSSDKTDIARTADIAEKNGFAYFAEIAKLEEITEKKICRFCQKYQLCLSWWSCRNCRGFQNGRDKQNVRTWRCCLSCRVCPEAR